MILKKPYAMFIKIFKPLHILLSGIVFYLIILENNVLSFLNEYLYSQETIVSSYIIDDLANSLLYILPIILILFSLLMLSIMFKKKKPTTFYIICIFCFIGIIIINYYSINFMRLLTESVVAIKSVKLIHDFIFINIFIECVFFALFLIRGTGVNLKKFDFDSDLSKMEISESDKEEIEVNINIDINEVRRKRRTKIRNYKYFYEENKHIIIASIFIFAVFATTIIVFLLLTNKKNTEGNLYNVDSFNIIVNSTYIINKDYKGEKLTNNYIVLVNAGLNSNVSNKKINLEDIKLEIETYKFKPTLKYSKGLMDLGNFYNGESLSKDEVEYLFAFEVPEKYINSRMNFIYNNVNSNLKILLLPNKYIYLNEKITSNIGETISFKKNLGDISFNIESYDIQNQYLIEYNYCVKKNDCILSKEYLKPSINENYDKVIFKLNLKYSNNSKLYLDFFDLFIKFGSINYKIYNVWYTQKSGFEEIKSLKSNKKNEYYIGINPNIKDADEIYLMFNIRGCEYKYILKGEI